MHLRAEFVNLKKMKTDLIKKYQTHAKDTGSSEVQIVLLTERILELAKHLRKFPKDLKQMNSITKLTKKLFAFVSAT